MCIYFRNLNWASQKDNYLVSPMVQILQLISGLKNMSLLEEFSGYNQILVSHFDQTMMTFFTKWVTYRCRNMPFRLINIRATFQWAMNIALHGLINKSMVIYLRDIMIFSKKTGDHLLNLWQIFERCRKYRISLNPKKNIFTVSEWNILGYLICKEGVVIDLDRTESIIAIAYPNNKKDGQSFL